MVLDDSSSEEIGEAFERKMKHAPPPYPMIRKPHTARKKESTSGEDFRIHGFLYEYCQLARVPRRSTPKNMIEIINDHRPFRLTVNCLQYLSHLTSKDIVRRNL